MEDKKTRILLIEDDRGLSSTIKSFLEEREYQVACVYDGLEGLNAILNDKPDLVILDIMLPRLDGRDILKKMRSAQSAAKDIPVIILSAKGEQYDRDIGLELGAYDYISKPYNSIILLKQIKNVLEKTKGVK